ncbi:hypothetical protein [Bradyrhizobium sp. AT1]|uniref:hypothetical protein n=1 Tax=Bradyrhizobium sp. AT1 TaxID=574934 RepID=UPI000AEBCAB3|nr:hypothetical protein [Bradyrhizobium sp. AT1]
MAGQETCQWIGSSGQKYLYYVYPRGPSINAGQDGNYIYAKKNAAGYWVPIYIGEGDLSKRASTDHHRSQCIDLKGATHVHLRLNPSKDARRAEEQDLLKNYKNALTPHGCNISPTG